MSSWFRRPRPSLDELEAIRASRADGVRRVISVAGGIVLVFIAFIASLLVLTPLLETANLRQEKAEVEEQLRRAQQEEEEAHNRFRWMADPEYFEQQARDRANQAKADEVVIRRPSPEEEQAMQRAATAAERDRAAVEKKADKTSESKKGSSKRQRRSRR